MIPRTWNDPSNCAVLCISIQREALLISLQFIPTSMNKTGGETYSIILIHMIQFYKCSLKRNKYTRNKNKLIFCATFSIEFIHRNSNYSNNAGRFYNDAMNNFVNTFCSRYSSAKHLCYIFRLILQPLSTSLPLKLLFSLS